MKRILVLFVFLLFAGEIFSQELEGEWSGYSWNNNNKYNNKISLKIYLSKLNDSTYKGQIVSTLQLHTVDTATCNIEAHLSDKKYLVIEEKEITKRPVSAYTHTNCLQVMTLKYNEKRKKLKFTGTWKTSEEDCGYGSIMIYKSN